MYKKSNFVLYILTLHLVYISHISCSHLSNCYVPPFLSLKSYIFLSLCVSISPRVSPSCALCIKLHRTAKELNFISQVSQNYTYSKSIFSTCYEHEIGDTRWKYTWCMCKHKINFLSSLYYYTKYKEISVTIIITLT